MPDAPELVAEPSTPIAAGTRYSPVVWLNLLCLDAPIVAVSWQWLFAHTFGAHLSLALRALLFLTAWLIYLADRFADTIKLPAGSPISLRHQFLSEAYADRSVWWIAVVVIPPSISRSPCAASTCKCCSSAARSRRSADSIYYSIIR